MRTKQAVRKPNLEKTQTHNDPRIRVEELNKTVVQLTQRLSKLETENAEREQQKSEYEASLGVVEIETSITEDAPTPEKVYGKPRIEWLDVNNNECRRASITVPEDWDKPIIFVKGDEQLGHVTCDEERILKDIAWVEKNPQCLVMLLGDAIDAHVQGSPGSPRENKSAPIAQANRYVEIHRPIRDRIIGYVGGNHERRIDKALTEGGAGVKLIAEGLSTSEHKIPYSGGILLLDLYWRDHLWTFTLFHGAGAAATAGSRTQRLQRNILLSDSLITLSGHLHDEMKTSRRFMKRTADGKIKIAKQTALQCGTYMTYIGSYGEIGGMAPTGPDMIVVELLEDGSYIDRFKGKSDN
jgi:hypothetical protein